MTAVPHWDDVRLPVEKDYRLQRFSKCVEALRGKRVALYGTGVNAREIIERLRDGENRCIVSDVRCSIATIGTTSVEAQATFYETMVEGTPDAGLPADAAKANQ